MKQNFVQCFVLVGPSAVGKSTLISELKKWGFPFRELISYTTRSPRIGEENGKDFFFVSRAKYAEIETKNGFILSTQVHENWYGISREWLNHELEWGIDVVCSLNTEAAKHLQTFLGDRVVTIYIAPPSFDILKERIIKRNLDGDSARKIRLRNAEHELKMQDSFKYKIVNGDLSSALEALKRIVLLEAKSKLIVKQFVSGLNNEKEIRAMSYNIRMAPCFEDDGTENAWRYRLPKIRMIIHQYRPDIIGLQEVSFFQMNSLEKSSFDLPYKMIGKYPSRKPIESGLGIIYNTEKIALISDLKTIWLNEAQNSSEGPAWDGSPYERYVIYAKFKNLITENEFWFLTTHFDHLGKKARFESTKIVLELVRGLDRPFILTGDFNCFPEQGGAELYELLSTSSLVKDSKRLAEKVFGVPGSWIGWSYDPYKQKTGHSAYDFIFTNPLTKVAQHGIIDDTVWDSFLQKELYPSDHRPVLSDLEL